MKFNKSLNPSLKEKFKPNFSRMELNIKFNHTKLNYMDSIKDKDVCT